MKPLIPAVTPLIDYHQFRRNDSILNSATLRFKHSRLRLRGQILSPVAGRVVAIDKSRRLLCFRAQNGTIYWWRLALIWPTCAFVPFQLMVKVGDEVVVGQPLAVMVNVWGPAPIMVMVVQQRLNQLVALLRAQQRVSLKLVRYVESVLTRTVLNLTGNHQVKIIGPPWEI
ncbi:hypothetical protein D1831_13345 [Lactiplantibacillus garii]|uniref:PTS EIIA type-1 domain-containing protein n=1 Tax=Lactiplantibacillus garii TaxID=2306423 RepID=A0A3R8J537_9LACO|nr:hypothetical protein [Lactiplantibacillus garii]RRK09324.1 hypothetical protein D1831_13345 [Lactiplantibacillus garii]